MKVEVFESSDNQVIPLKGNLGLLAHYQNKTLHPNNCGAIATDYFCIEMSHFTEAQCHNTCLNRKVCIDAEGNIKSCRAFIKAPCNIYSQPAKCTYNPYICLWEGQDGYVPVEACGTYSRETGFVPDKEKIARLNREIWGGGGVIRE